MDSKKILNLVTIVMFVITVVLLGLFMFGGEVPNQPYTTPVYIDIIELGIYPVWYCNHCSYYLPGDSSVYPPETSDEKLYRISRSSRSHPDRVCTG